MKTSESFDNLLQKTCRVLLRLVQLQRLILLVYIINRLLYGERDPMISIHSFVKCSKLVNTNHNAHAIHVITSIYLNPLFIWA